MKRQSGVQPQRKPSRQELWDVLSGDREEGMPIEEILSKTSYDELLEIDIPGNYYRYIDHVDDKFVGNVSEGDFRRLYDFAIDHFVHPQDAENYRELLNPDTLLERLRTSSVPCILAGNFRLKSTDGNWIWTRQLLVGGEALDREPGLVYCYVYDMSRQKHRVDGQTPAGEYSGTLPRREEVTGLPEGMDFFRPAQERLKELESGWYIIDIRIIHFKLFTDWYGLASGRYLLTQTAEILQRHAVLRGGMPGYLGREEFCLLAPCSPEEIGALYEEINGLIRSVSSIDGFLAVFGAAPIDGSGTQIMEYYNHAALTLEEAVQNGSAGIRYYDEEFQQKYAQEYRLVYEFGQALENGEISFRLQPQYRVSNRKIVGAESLARWQRPDGSMISPAVFVPVLEKFNMVIRLDTFIWESVCRLLRSWIDRGLTPVPISVNVSRVDIFSVNVPEHFLKLLDTYRLPVNLIKIEITETDQAGDAIYVRRTVARLRELGFTVLMDDFGSGYSSLNMLHSINVDLIKLDLQFLRLEREEEHKGISIIESIVNMTKTLGIPMIVEGVETREQVHFLSDLGCRFMQGYYFCRPVPIEEFEEMIRSADRVDRHGFLGNNNRQLHVREFLDESVFSDVMLNNILGPVAFYCWHGENVDIIRYNQQFYKLVGIEVEDFNQRRIHIEKTLPPEDKDTLYSLLEHAMEHRAVGSKGLVRSYRPNGVLVWLSLQIYYLGEDEEGRKFYASAQDVSDQQFISSDLAGGYYRSTLEDGFEFLYIGRNFLKLTGYQEEEIAEEFDNRLINMVHPDDRQKLLEQARAVALGESRAFSPYRLRRKEGGYLYVADQSRLTDQYGTPCWQSVAIDVSEVMYARNQMRILSAYLRDEILFLRRSGEELLYEAAVHGLEDCLAMDREAFEECLNSGTFCRWIEGYRNIPHREYTEQFITALAGGERELTVHHPNGKILKLRARADRVGEGSEIEFIVFLHCLSSEE